MTTEDIKKAILNFYGKDNKEHSIAEFRNEAAKMGIKGFTPGQLSGAIYQLYATEELIKTSRGVYRRNTDKCNSEIETRENEQCPEWRKKIGLRISAMEKDMAEIVNEIDLLEISESDFELIREVKQNILMLRRLKQKCTYKD